jgi:hypothetical protein
MAERKKGKKGRKIGRWSKKPTNLAYKAQNRRDANKKRRIEKMIRRFPRYRAPGWIVDRATGKVNRNKEEK